MPPDGREKLVSPKRSSKKAPNSNLSCGDVNCSDIFCRAQVSI
jgi:hypothetical protein